MEGKNRFRLCQRQVLFIAQNENMVGAAVAPAPAPPKKGNDKADKPTHFLRFSPESTTMKLTRQEIQCLSVIYVESITCIVANGLRLTKELPIALLNETTVKYQKKPDTTTDIDRWK